MQGSAIPTTVDEITAEWLTATLAKDYPGTIVTSAVRGEIIHGTATKVRLLLGYNDAGHAHRLPPTMWFKGGLESYSDSEDMLKVYAGEASFYRDMAGTLDLNIPGAFAVVMDEASGRSVLLLEDLLARNATFGSALRPLSPSAIAAWIEELARLHAAYWDSPRLKDIPWLQGGGSLLQSCEATFSERTWERCIGLPRAEFVPNRFRDFAFLRNLVLHTMRTDVEHANCFVHGDGHIGNTFTSADRGIGILDWQSTMHGNWAHDLTYCLITGLTVDDRRHAERDLIAHYIATLAELGIDLDPDRAWLEHRRHTAYSCAWIICLPEWQPEEVCCTVVERAFAAATDLATVDAW